LGIIYPASPVGIGLTNQQNIGRANGPPGPLRRFPASMPFIVVSYCESILKFHGI
jgi:hypothetical protein